MDKDQLTPEEQERLALLRPYNSMDYAKRHARNGINFYDAAKRQATISTQNAYCFYSYETLIALSMNGQMYLTPEWDYSNTTSRYRQRFLSESTTETRQKLQNSIYIYLGGPMSI